MNRRTMLCFLLLLAAPGCSRPVAQTARAAAAIPAAKAAPLAEEPLVLEPDPSRIAVVDAELLAKVRRVLELRLQALDLPTATVTNAGPRFEVRLPADADVPWVAAALRRTGKLELRHLSAVVTDRNPTARYRMQHLPGPKGDQYTFYDQADGRKTPTAEALKQQPLILGGEEIQPPCKAYASPATGQPVVEFTFSPAGMQTFAAFTTENVGELLAIVLDGKILSAPLINEPITGGHGQISGGFRDLDEARAIAAVLGSAPLPIPLRVVDKPRKPKQ